MASDFYVHTNLFKKFKDKDGKVCEVYAPISKAVIELSKDQYRISDNDKN